jgi:hypothetical protein
VEFGSVIISARSSTSNPEWRVVGDGGGELLAPFLDDRPSCVRTIAGPRPDAFPYGLGPADLDGDARRRCDEAGWRVVDVGRDELATRSVRSCGP